MKHVKSQIRILEFGIHLSAHHMTEQLESRQIHVGEKRGAVRQYTSQL
jgi:hypothetical protein